MHRDEIARLATIADAVVGKRGQVVPLDKWQPPKCAHLLKAPAALIDAIVGELEDDGTRGEPLPWPKTRSLFRLRTHELTVWAGSNGSYKSTVMSEVMLSLVTRRRRVVIVSLEMPAYKVGARMAVQALTDRFPARSRVESWAEDLGDVLSFLDLTGELAPDEVVKLVRYCAHELGTQHILLDNLTKIVSADNEHVEQQRRFMAQLHRTSIETGVHVHVVAHTRKPAGDELKPPGRYEIAGSRTLSDQPDNIVMVWRNRVKESKVASDKPGYSDQSDVVLRVDKQRHGTWEGQIQLWTDRTCFRFVGDRSERPKPYFGA